MCRQKKNPNACREYWVIRAAQTEQPICRMGLFRVAAFGTLMAYNSSVPVCIDLSVWTLSSTTKWAV